MHKTVLFEELADKKFDAAGISNHKLTGKCIICKNTFTYSHIKQFLLNRKKREDKKELWQTCQVCWHACQTYKDPVWIKKNSESQLIAQNKPEQLIKNAIGVSKSWTRARKAKASKYLIDRWKNDEDFAKKAASNIKWVNDKSTEQYRNMMTKSLGTGGLRGSYKNIYYDSALELSFIIYCEENSIKIKRYDIDPIPYVDENGQERKYFPDFIINDNTIVEIKGFGLWYKKNFQRNIKKIEALKLHKLSSVIIFSNDTILKLNYNKARKLHYENKK